MTTAMTDSNRRAAAQTATRADARRNCELLLDAASAVFAENGIDASLDEIARRAGVGIATLYRNFPTRDALLEALLRDRSAALLDKGTKLLQAPSPLDALAAWLTAVVEHARIYRGLVSSIASSLCGSGSSRLTPACEQMQAIGVALFERAQKAGEIRADAVAADVIAMANAVAWVGEHGAGERAASRRMLALLIDGLHNRPAAASGVKRSSRASRK